MEGLSSWWYGTTNSTTEFSELKEITFFIGDKEHTVNLSRIAPDTTLNTYLRQNEFLTGTKFMCLEGGCGACVVAVTKSDPLTLRERTYAVNSCLVPIYMCSSWKLHTIEKLGNPQKGYHPVQSALVKFNGTQCGYCSSGMLMNMYALYQSGDFTMQDVEKNFGGNICRCTGYRPILTAFKSLATDASSETLGHIPDVEDFPICLKGHQAVEEKNQEERQQMLQPHFYKFLNHQWFKVFSTNEIFDVFEQFPGKSYLLVGGDTAKGVYKRTKEPDLYIDITSVKKLVKYVVTSEGLLLGANMTLTNTIILFRKLSKENPNFSYLKKLAEHIELVANVPVRNIGTLAGNLYTKYLHRDFPSDIFVILETVGATLTLVNQTKEQKRIDLSSFLDFNMKHTVIESINLPALDDTYKLETYKIMPRFENAHAFVNAGFLFKFSNNKVASARIVYGGIRPSFIHAVHAEKYITNKDLFNNENMQVLFKTLNDEIIPSYVLPESSPEFRKKLAIALCYKYILSIAPADKISLKNKTGGMKQVRPISMGTQDYETNQSLYPLTQPISKIEAMAQCSGTAEYIMDMPDRSGQLYAAFVLAKAPVYSVIKTIDSSEALKCEGAVAFFTKDDIPGKNTFTPLEAKPFNVIEEELFCTGTVKYFYQPIGIIVATSQSVAEEAADLVNITYTTPTKKPLLTIRDIINAKATDKIHLESKLSPTSKGTDVKHVFKGTFYNGWQYHFNMETQCCAVVAVEDELDMFPSVQSINYAQIAAAKMLNIPVNKVNVTVRRLGGAYGGKFTRSIMVSCAAALAAYKLRKPVKLWMPLTTNMNVIGKRYPCYSTYEVGCDNKGAIQYLTANIYTDYGYIGGNEPVALLMEGALPLLYKTDTWDVTLYSTRSDSHTSAMARAPATTEITAFKENLMEHIASKLNMDPNQVRFNNLSSATEGEKYMKDLIQWADVEKRKQLLQDFNKVNRWVKRGIATVPMLFYMHLVGEWSVLVSIFQGDGSVSVAHGGIEMGQGINTKVAQVCAYSLGIPLDKISIKPSTGLATPNATSSVASITSEAVCFAVVKACDLLKQRMAPIKERMVNPTWPELVMQCYLENVKLVETFMYHPGLPELDSYPVYGATCAEVEVDILTGIYQVKRVDIIEDTGNSMSPLIDIGQVEGAFIMGLGYWTMENLVFSPDGQLLTNNTWTYKVPGARDIPVDFRVKFPKNNPNPVGVLHSKATGEPAVVMACSVPLAIRNAVGNARMEADPRVEKWYPLDGPSTVEDTFLKSLHNYKQYTL